MNPKSRLKLFHVFYFCLTLIAVPLKPSKWVHTHWSGERATLTLVHLNKEDEGLYTLRVNTKSGFDSYSAYVFVRGEASTSCRISRLKTKYSFLYFYDLNLLQTQKCVKI